MPDDFDEPLDTAPSPRVKPGVTVAEVADLTSLSNAA